LDDGHAQLGANLRATASTCPNFAPMLCSNDSIAAVGQPNQIFNALLSLTRILTASPRFSLFTSLVKIPNLPALFKD